MKIESLKISDFGLLKEWEEKKFAPKFNLVFGLNEAGKSTLLNFLVAMLYGMKKEGVSRRVWSEEHSLYKPWEGTGYGGEILFSLDDGRRIKVVRDFDEEHDSLNLIDDITGKDITQEYPIDRRKERLFAQEIIGLGKSLFLSSACIRQLESPVTDREALELASHARAVVDSGTKDVTAQNAIEMLESEIEAIGKTDNAKFFKIRIQREKELLGLISEHEEKLSRLFNIRAKLGAVESNISDRTLDLNGLRHSLLSEELSQERKRVKRAEDLIQEITRLKAEGEKLQHLDEFDPGKSKALFKLQADIEFLNHERDKKEKELKRMETELVEMGLDSKKLADASIFKEENLKKLQKHSWVKQAIIKELAEELSAFINELQGNGAKVPYTSEFHKIISSLPVQESEEIRSLQSDLLTFWREQRAGGLPRVWAVNIKAAAGFLSAAFLLLFSFIIKPGLVPDWIAISAATGLSTYNLFRILHGVKKTLEDDKVAERLEKLDELKQKNDSINKEAFSYLRKVYSDIKQKDINSHLIDKSVLAVDFSLKATEIKDEVKEILKLEKTKRNELQGILKACNVESIAEYEETLDLLAKREKSKNSFEKAEGELKALLQNKSVEMLKESIQKAEDEIHGLEIETSAEYMHTDGIDPGGAKERVKNIELELDDLKEKAVRLEEKIELIEDGIGDRNRYENELELVRQELASHRRYRRALEIAIETLRTVSQKVHRKFAPSLGKATGEILSAITGGKYQEIKAEEDLKLNVTDPNRALPVAASELSAGARDQVYLSLRIAIAQVLSSEGESLPVIIDDAFTQYDDERARNAMSALAKVSEKYQVLMFSCHQRDYYNFKDLLSEDANSKIIELQ